MTTEMPREDNFLFWVPPANLVAVPREAGRHLISGPGLFLLTHVEHPSHTETTFRLQVVFHA